MRKRAPGWRRLGLVVGGTIVGLLIGEMTLRLMMPSARLPFLINTHLENERGKFCRYDATLGWVGRPNVDEVFCSVDCHHLVRQNRYGFRGPAYPFDRSSQNRLLVLGDSFAWGYGVEEEHLFTTLLERRADPAIEVVNLGVSGYGTDQELLLYRGLGRQFQADRVLLVVTPHTDLQDNAFAESNGRPKPWFKMRRDDGKVRLELSGVPVPQRNEPWSSSPLAVDFEAHWLCPLAAQSSLIATTIQAIATSESALMWLESKNILPPRQGAYDWEALTHRSVLAADFEGYFQLLLLLIEELHADVSRDGVQLTLLLVPSSIDVDPELWNRFKASNHLPVGVSWDRDHIRRRLTEYCTSREIDLVDPTDALRQAAQQNRYLYFPWNRHWTHAGHELVADLLLKELIVTPP